MARNKTVLLTLGRLPVGLDIARAFHAAGWRVLVADPWAMHLLRMSESVSGSFVVPSPHSGPEDYYAHLTRIADRESVDLIVPVSEESVYVSALRDRGLPVFSMGQTRTLELHDKAGFIRLAERLGLPVPRTALAGESPEFIESTAYVSKPRFSCSGRGVSFHSAGTPPTADDQTVLQEQLQGEHQSVFCVARDGVVSACAVYRPVASDGSVAIAFESVRDPGSVMDWATKFISASKHSGFISFDFIVEQDGRSLPIECNPRATSGIHFVSAESLVAAMTGDLDGTESRPPGGLRMKESYSCFTRLLGSIFSLHRFRTMARTMRESSDITWRRDDPWPFLLMMINSWRIIWMAMSGKHSFASASVADVEWRPDKSP